MISRRDSESLRRRAAERWNESEKEAGVTTADTEAEKRSRAHRTWLQATKVVDTVPTNPCVAYFSGRQYSPEGVPPQEEISSPKDARRPQRLPVRVLSNLVELIQRDDARVLALAREISAMGSGRLVRDELHVASHDHVQNDEGILELESEPRAGIVVDDRFANIPTFIPNSVEASATSPTTSPAMENNRLTVRSPEINQIRLKAMDDARQMQVRVIEHCRKSKRDPPPYVLEELIGKGSFGRVYKGKNVNTAAVVAIKIIDIDESDAINPRNADSYSEFLKEINALKVLSEKKAKNINLVIDAMPVNQAMWMITEYCGGGSVATLMKPTAPGGLNEKWIIPILREAAVAIMWVHEAGIIHRDIKCANVLVTEQGEVQLCDFGVAGVVESKLDKRSTIIGTPHWMAPELFGASPSYGSEVDIWAFGSMIFEIATGLPPNVANGVSYDRLGSYLQKHTPRLEGGNYSNNLRDLVAYCLEEDPKKRPTIGQVQRHPYIANTSSSYPTVTLKTLVGSFKVWESRGNSRHSLFMQHGAQGPSSANAPRDEWNFNGTEQFEDNVWGQYGVKDVIETYGSSVVGFVEETARPPAKVSRRRPPPEALGRLPTVPLEQIFDPKSNMNYMSNAKGHYDSAQMGLSDRSDLPLRDDSAQPSIRDTMIDLGGHNIETGLSSFPEMGTIKAGRRARDESEDQHNATLPDFSRPALSDPVETNTNRRTQDWKFPSMASPVSADPEPFKFPASFEVTQSPMTPGLGARPALVHHTTEPVGAFGGGFASQPPLDRMSVQSVTIDLDDIMRDIPEVRRPSTANSDLGSITGEQMNTTNPFALERHASLYQPLPPFQGREPSIYVSDDVALPPRLQNGNALQELAEMSDFSASDAEGSNSRNLRDINVTYGDSEDSYYVVNPGRNGTREGRNDFQQFDGIDERDYRQMQQPSVSSGQATPLPQSDSFPIPRIPDLPPFPSQASLTGTASSSEMTMEITKIVAAMNSQLEVFKDIYDTGNIAQRQNSNRRMDSQEVGTQ
ncbi:related to severin kinase [Rhynchosporium secalis]|uniref:non-specific serine/threonine protein kinase n=1 Tax=Rhynchosporium secalis TaxID=38038 RepID=A0A1E1MDZ9_RHYSE|nr:related to severin kinase [Rhynchosporium secalis]